MAHDSEFQEVMKYLALPLDEKRMLDTSIQKNYLLPLKLKILKKR